MTPKWVPGQSLPKQENVEKEISSHAFLTYTKQLLSFLLLWCEWHLLFHLMEEDLQALFEYAMDMVGQILY